MTLRYDNKDLMLSIMALFKAGAGEAAFTDATVAFYASDSGQRERFTESCFENLKRMRDEMNEILAQSEKGAHREAA